METDDQIYSIFIFSLEKIVIDKSRFFHIQGSPKSKPLSRIIIKSY